MPGPRVLPSPRLPTPLPFAKLRRMSRAFVQSICQPLPGAEVSDPWGGGHDAWKVGGKMFACIGATDQGVAVKTADADFARMMIEAGDAERAPYFHKSWVLLPWGSDEGLMRDRIIISYDIVRAGLTKKVQATLAPRDA
jgi:predicted DNA-binding protein (MmcQ/YjbR family)